MSVRSKVICFYKMLDTVLHSDQVHSMDVLGNYFNQ
jgi:hypothetical protein